MKSYEEVAREVFSRRDLFEEKKARRQTAFRHAAVGLQVLVIAVMVISTAGIAYAIATGTGVIADFLGIFGRNSQNPLSESQQQFIADAAVELGESVTSNGVTVTVTGAFTDGTTALILLDIAAPEGADLNGLGLGLNANAKGLVRGDNPEKYLDSTGLSITNFCLDDSDGKPNTQSMMLRITTVNLPGSDFSFADGYYRYLRLDEIFAHQDEYPYSKYTIAEGNWEFRFLFADVNGSTVELLDAPIQLQARRATTSDYQIAVVSSISVKALSIVFHHTFDSDAVQEPGDFGTVQVVLKDGSVIKTHLRSGITAQTNSDFVTAYVAEEPIVFSEVDHIQIGEAAAIPMPESVDFP